MNEITSAPASADAQNKIEFMLAAIRTARLRIQGLSFEVDEVGVALKFGMVSAEFAVSWLDYIGAMPFINATWDKCEVIPVCDCRTDVPAATPAAAQAHQKFKQKMAPGGEIDRMMRGGA